MKLLYRLTAAAALAVPLAFVAMQTPALPQAAAPIASEAAAKTSTVKPRARVAMRSSAAKRRTVARRSARARVLAHRTPRLIERGGMRTVRFPDCVFMWCSRGVLLVGVGF
jgi:hypothetical protein